MDGVTRPRRLTAWQEFCAKKPGIAAATSFAQNERPFALKKEDLSYGQKRKQRRVGDSGRRQITLSKVKVLKEFIPNPTLLIEHVLKRERMDLLLVRNGGNS
jgi:hypothetical protein